MMARHMPALLLLTGLLAIGLVGCGGKDVSMEAYNKVQTGMTYAEVERILGKGEAPAGGSVSIGEFNLSAKVYVWKDGPKQITVTFVNNKVTAKTETGM